MNWSLLLVVALFFVGCLLMARLMMLGSRLPRRVKKPDAAVERDTGDRNDAGTPDRTTLRE